MHAHPWNVLQCYTNLEFASYYSLAMVMHILYLSNALQYYLQLNKIFTISD